jgi:dienelactone hydrolase
MEKICWLIFVALFASSGFAADTKIVSYKSGDETVQAVLYTPSGKGPFPALIVIHEYCTMYKRKDHRA